MATLTRSSAASSSEAQSATYTSQKRLPRLALGAPSLAGGGPAGAAAGAGAASAASGSALCSASGGGGGVGVGGGEWAAALGEDMVVRGRRAGAEGQGLVWDRLEKLDKVFTESAKEALTG